AERWGLGIARTGSRIVQPLLCRGPPRRRTAPHRRHMSQGDVAARELRGLAALRAGLGLARDPIEGMRRSYDEYGPFVVLGNALPLAGEAKMLLLGVPLVLTAGAALNREVLSDPDTWRSVSFLPGGPRHSAARRLNDNLTRMTG